MWKSSNKLIESKNHKMQHKKLVKSLLSVKSSINNKPPQKFIFLKRRNKSKQIQYQKKTQIDRQNEILLRKMINHQSHLGFRGKSLRKSSLHASYSRKQSNQIKEGNKFLVKKLLTVSSEYSQDKLSKPIHSNQRMRTNPSCSSKIDPFGIDSSQKLIVESFSRYDRPYTAKK